MDYQKMVEFRNARNHFTRRLNIVLQEIGPSYARVTKTVEPEDTNPVGVPHGEGLSAELRLLERALGKAGQAVIRRGNRAVRERFCRR